MTWRTPCVDEPEFWTGNLAESRAEAARICLTVCRVRNPEAFAACEQLARETKPEFGVYAGKDYAPDTPNLTCQGPGCDRPLDNTKPGRAPKFCSQSCRGNFNYEQKRAQTKACEACGETFMRRKLSISQWEARRFCSVACSCRTLRPERAA